MNDRDGILKEVYTEMAENHFDTGKSLLEIVDPDWVSRPMPKPPRFRRIRAVWNRIADAWGVLIGKYEAYSPDDDY